MTKEMAKEMTKEEMMKMIETLTNENETLKSNECVSDKVKSLIESGINTIEDLSDQLKISSKNVSSNLTKLRNEMKENGQTIVSYRTNNLTYLSVQNFEDLGWKIS